MSLSASAPSIDIPKNEGIDRKCKACEMKKKEEEAEEEGKEKLIISRKSSNTCDLKANDEFTDEIKNVRSGAGSSLKGETKEFMESRFDKDFSKVQIHSDERAAYINGAH